MFTKIGFLVQLVNRYLQWYNFNAPRLCTLWVHPLWNPLCWAYWLVPFSLHAGKNEFRMWLTTKVWKWTPNGPDWESQGSSDLGVAAFELNCRSPNSLSICLRWLFFSSFDPDSVSFRFWAEKLKSANRKILIFARAPKSKVRWPWRAPLKDPLQKQNKRKGPWTTNERGRKQRAADTQ